MLSIRAAQPARNGQKCHLMSFPLTRANRSVLGMIQYHHWIFDISVRGELVSRFHLTELRQSTRKFVRTLFPAWFNYRTMDVLKSRIKGACIRTYCQNYIFLLHFSSTYKNWIFTFNSARKRYLKSISKRGHYI